MARAIEIHILPAPRWQALRWYPAGCSALIAVTLYLEGAIWPAAVAIALAVLGLARSGEKSVRALRFEPLGRERFSETDRHDRCELVTADGVFASRLIVVFGWGSLRVLRLRANAPVRTLVLWPGVVAASQRHQLGRWLKALIRP